MSTLLRVRNKGQVTIPTRLRTKAGISEGDFIEASFHRGRIVLTPRAGVDTSGLPNTDDEYTPRQRKAIDTRLAESEGELRNELGFGPFDSADEMIAHMKTQLKKKAASKKK